MDSNEMMAGYYCTLFSRIPDADRKNVQQLSLYKINEEVVKCLENNLDSLQDTFQGKFENRSFEIPSVERIKFPDLILTQESLNNYFSQKEVQEGLKYITAKEMCNLFMNIDYITIEVNPSDSYAHIDRASKIFVNAWHSKGLPSEKIGCFYKICERITQTIALRIQNLYINCLKGTFDRVEKNSNSKFITNVFFNEEIKSSYEKLIETLDKDNSVEYSLVAEVWQPLLDYGCDLFGKNKTIDDYRLFIQNFYSNVRQKELKGVFGITRGVSDNGYGFRDLTQLVGISPFPREITAEIQNPIKNKM